MRRSMVVVAALSIVAILGLARCGNNGGNGDTGTSGGLDATAAAGDAQTAAGDAAVAAGDAATAGLDAATAGADAATAAPDVGVLPITPCTPVDNFGCDAGVCFTTAISQTGVETTGCGQPGTGGNYAPCATAENCSANHTCLALQPDAGSVCHQYCTPSLACPGTEAAPQNCIAFNGTTLVGYCVQVQACSLYTQDCADNALGCYPVSSGAGGCVKKGNNKAGDTCTLHTDCEPGLACPPDTGGKVCRALCDPAVANTCTTGTCTQLTAHTWGYCK